MIKIFLFLLIFSTITYASFMDRVGDIVESTLSDKDENIPEVQTVGTLSVKSTLSSKKQKDSDSVLDTMVNSVKGTIGIKKEKKEKKKSFTSNILTTVKEVTGLEKIEDDNTFFDGGILGSMADIIELEEGENLGLPSLFGFNKKKKKTLFGSTILGNTILGDMKETTTSFYRGFRHTGESTEFMSGMMYKSSKVYNGMFKIFDNSPMNIFDDKNTREPSVFDVFGKGNDMLDMID